MDLTGSLDRPDYGSERFEIYRQVAMTGEAVTSDQQRRDGAWGDTRLAQRAFDTIVAPMGENVVSAAVRSSRASTPRGRKRRPRPAPRRDRIGPGRNGHRRRRRDDHARQRSDRVSVRPPASSDSSGRPTRCSSQSTCGIVTASSAERNAANRRPRPMGGRPEQFARRKDGSDFSVETSLSPVSLLLARVGPCQDAVLSLGSL